MILLGLGYLLLAAAGAACWGLALAGSVAAAGPRTDHEPARRGRARGPGRAGGGGVAPRPAGSGIRAGEGGRGPADQRRHVDPRGGDVVDAASRLPVSARRDGITAGAFAAAAAAAAAEVVLTIAVGAPRPLRQWSCSRPWRDGGRDGARPHRALGRIPATSRRSRRGIRRRDRRVCVVAFVTMSGAGALQAAGSARRARTTTIPAAPPHPGPTAARSPN